MSNESSPHFSLSAEDVRRIEKHYWGLRNFPLGLNRDGYISPKVGDRVVDRAISEHLGRFEDASVVDIGCGTGRLIERLAEFGVPVTPDRYYGVDIVGKTVKKARKKHPEYRFDSRNILEEPIKDTFDIAVCIGPLFHRVEGDQFRYVEEMMQELQRISNIGFIFDVDCREIANNPGDPLMYYDRSRINRILNDFAFHNPEYTVQHNAYNKSMISGPRPAYMFTLNHDIYSCMRV